MISGATTTANATNLGSGSWGVDVQAPTCWANYGTFNIAGTLRQGRVSRRRCRCASPSLTNTGGGTLTLTGGNTYSGTTFVNGGTLLVAGTSSLSCTNINIGQWFVNTGGTSLGSGSLVLSGQNSFSGSGGLVAISGSGYSSPFKATGLGASTPIGPRPKTTSGKTGQSTFTGGTIRLQSPNGDYESGSTTIENGFVQGGLLGLTEGTGNLVLCNTNSFSLGTLTLNPNYVNIVPLSGGTLSIGSIPSLVLSASATGGNLTSTNFLDPRNSPVRVFPKLFRWHVTHDWLG